MLRAVRVAVIAAVLVTPGRADDRTDCAEAHVTERAPRAIAACTALIERDAVDAGRLAWAYNQRGLAYFTAHWQWSEWALADFMRAIKLKGDFAEAYFHRAVKTGLPVPLGEARLADLKEAIRLKPGYAAAYVARGSVLLELKKGKEALEDYSAALRLEPSAKNFAVRAAVHDALGEKEAADADYVEALKASPREMETLMGGWSSQEIIRRLSRYLEADPKSGQAYFFRGRARGWRSEEIEAVTGDYLKAWELEPRLIYGITGQSDGLPALDRVVEREPKWATGYHLRAWARWQAGEQERALADFEQALGLDPKYAEAYFDRGRLRAKADGVGAIADFKKAFELQPDLIETDSWRQFGWGARAGADAAWRMALVNAVIEVAPGYATAYVRRGLARAEAGDTEGARGDYERSIELEPGGHFPDRARLAVVALSAALKETPKDVDRLFARARAYAELGQTDAAIEDLTAALGLRPDWGEAYLLRGRQYRLKNEVERGISDLEAALRHKGSGLRVPAEDLGWLGRRYVERKRWDEAIAVLTEAAGYGGSDGGWLIYARGGAYLGKGGSPALEAIGFSGEYAGSARRWAERWDQKAIADWRKGIALDPGLWASQLVDVAEKLRSSGDAKGALEEFTRGVILAPVFAPAFERRAAQLVLMERYDEAIADYDEAIRLRESGGAAGHGVYARHHRGEAYFSRGEASSAKGAHEEAVSDFSKALEDVEDRRRLEIRIARAAAHVRAGAYVSAAADYGRVGYLWVAAHREAILIIGGIAAVLLIGWWVVEYGLARLWRWVGPHLPEGPAIWRLDKQEQHREILDRFGRLKWATRRELAYVIDGAESMEREAALVVRAGRAYLDRPGEWSSDVGSAYNRKLALALAMTGTVFDTGHEDGGILLHGDDRNFNLLQYAAQTVVGAKVWEFKIEDGSEQAVVDGAITKMRGELAVLKGEAVWLPLAE